MICFFFRKGRLHAERAAEVDAQRERIEDQWDEVNEISTMSRKIRERNHLTEQFEKIFSGGGRP